MEEELALIEQLAKWLPATQLILDANGGWTHKEAQRFCERLPLNISTTWKSPALLLLTLSP